MRQHPILGKWYFPGMLTLIGVTTILIGAALAETSPMPMMQNMVGQLAGQLAMTQAELQDARVKIQQMEQEKAAAKPVAPAEQDTPK